MMSALTRKHDEAKRLLELYMLYKDSGDDWRRRKAHVDLDRFLMENRETAILCIERVLQDEINAQIVDTKQKYKLATKILRPPWYQRLAYRLQRKGGASHDGPQIQSDTSTRDA